VELRIQQNGAKIRGKKWGAVWLPNDPNVGASERPNVPNDPNA
jgi:hypothetical protein